MKNYPIIFKETFTIFLLSALLLLPDNLIHACDGPPVPVCGKTVTISKSVPAVVVIPPGGDRISLLTSPGCGSGPIINQSGNLDQAGAAKASGGSGSTANPVNNEEFYNSNVQGDSQEAQQRHCGSMEYLAYQLKNDKERRKKMEEIEKYTQYYIENLSEMRQGMTPVLTIPVVFHVIYNNAAENLATSLILDQLQILNDDFRRMNSDQDSTWPQAADTEIEFCLATVDPLGSPTTGITRTATSVPVFGADDSMKFDASGGKDAWPASDYLNFWICDITPPLLGYAQFPGGAPATDGVVCDFEFVGTTTNAPYNLGRTATHEVGHWLNLRHIWGDGDCSVDDMVSDTPNSDAANFGCLTGSISCTTTDMVQNYMDYSDDACMNLFTAGQRDRMQALLSPGGSITIPINIVPTVNWNNTTPVCPAPTAATLSITLICMPSGVTITQTFPVPLPTSPGVQIVPSIQPANFIIAPGVFPPESPPQFCIVEGTYSVVFSDGVTVSALGDTEVCIVDPSPLDPTIPRLNMTYLQEDGELYRTCRQGDQSDFHFLIENNDPDNAVSFLLSSIGRQTAQLPLSHPTIASALIDDVYAISNPIPNTDAFPSAFADDMAPDSLLAETDPAVIDSQLLTRIYNLQPLEATIVTIRSRSFGKCANGSCNERLVRVEGLFANGDPALACASTLYYVDDVDPKTVLCEFSDTVKTIFDASATWGPGIFGNDYGPIPKAETFAPGNTDFYDPFQGYITNGPLFPFPVNNYPEIAGDIIRSDQNINTLQYDVLFISPQCSNNQSLNFVNIFGIDNPYIGNISVPVVSWPLDPFTPLQIFMDLNANILDINASGYPLYFGPIDNFFAFPPPNLCVDYETCRIITKVSSLAEKSISVESQSLSRLFEGPYPPPACDDLFVYDNLANPVDWDAVINGSGLILPSPSGFGLLSVCYDGIELLPTVPQTTVTYLEVSSPLAINNPVKVPVAIRVKECKEIQTIVGLIPEGVQTYQADDVIFSNARIFGDAQDIVTYRAGNNIATTNTNALNEFIELQIEFDADGSRHFSIEIGDCNDGDD